nr:ATP-binding protein [Halobacterium salinarum]
MPCWTRTPRPSPWTWRASRRPSSSARRPTPRTPTSQSTRPRPPSPPPSPQIGTAIQEVVTNAIQHADCTAPQVSVSVSEPTATEGMDHVRITVSDHGPGIPRMERRVLNGDDAIDALHHSQGLGLWLVYWAVTHSDGDLDFEDNTPQGSVVTIRLPARDDTA